MSVDGWIDFAKGPLFAFTFLVMVLGLGRHVVVQIYELITEKGRRLQNAAWRTIVLDALSWVVPVKHLVKGTIFFSIVSFLFHIGAIIVPLLLADHIVLWEGLLGINLPQLGAAFADYLTLFTIVCLFVLLGFRLISRRHRAMSRGMDYVLLMTILLPFATGFMAAHPAYNPFSWHAVMLVHLLSAELLFILIPFTKLAHIVLFAFDRVSGLHWQLRPGAGDKVAGALFGKEARV